MVPRNTGQRTYQVRPQERISNIEYRYDLFPDYGGERQIRGEIAASETDIRPSFCLIPETDLSPDCPPTSATNLDPSLSVERNGCSRFATKQERMTSFQDWVYDQIVKREGLVEAGFLYTGKGDEVLCLWCKLRVLDWKKGDDPFVEHALNEPKCDYLQLNYDPALVQAIAAERVAHL